MTEVYVAPGLYTWQLEYEDGRTGIEVAPNLDSLIDGSMPVVKATRGPAFTTDGPTPVVSSLVPATAKLGDPNFTLHVHGTGFRDGAVILWNGSPEPTTYVSPTELTTGVNMATAQVAMPIPVSVRSLAGQISNALTFTLTPSTP